MAQRPNSDALHHDRSLLVFDADEPMGNLTTCLRPRLYRRDLAYYIPQLLTSVQISFQEGATIHRDLPSQKKGVQIFSTRFCMKKL